MNTTQKRFCSTGLASTSNVLAVLFCLVPMLCYAPVLLNFNISRPSAGGTVALTWNSSSSFMYQLHFKTNVNQTNWSNLGSLIMGTGSLITVNDNISTNSQRFYRLEQLF